MAEDLTRQISKCRKANGQGEKKKMFDFTRNQNNSPPFLRSCLSPFLPPAACLPFDTHPTRGGRMNRCSQMQLVELQVGKALLEGN